MLSTVGVKLDFTGVIDPDLNWTVPRSNKRAARRARASLTGNNRKKQNARSLKGSEVPIEKDPRRVKGMAFSESEKIGLSILGRRFSNKAENLPIKKRKFPVVRSPSPPPLSTPCTEESECIQESQSTVYQKKTALSLNGERHPTLGDTSDSTLMGESVEGEHNLRETNEKLSDSEDFSGISILAAAACSSNIDCDTSDMEDPAVYSSLSEGKGSSGAVWNTYSETCLMQGEFHKKHTANCSSRCNKSDPSICIEAVSEKNSSVADSNEHEKDNQDKKCLAEFETLQRVGNSHMWDGRLRWDLNVVMDVWESPCDDPFVDSKSNAAFATCKDGEQKGKMINFEHCQVQIQPSEKDQTEIRVRQNVGDTVTTDGGNRCIGATSSRQETRLFSCDSSVVDMVANKNENACLLHPKSHGSYKEERLLKDCTDFDSAILPGRKITCRSSKSPSRATTISEETKLLYYKEVGSSIDDFTDSATVGCDLGARSSNARVVQEPVTSHCTSVDRERDNEALSSPSFVCGDAYCSHPSHLHEPLGMDHIFNNATTEDAIAPGLVEQSKDQFHSRSICHVNDHVTSNSVADDDKLSSPVVAVGSQAETDVQSSKVNCLHSVQDGSQVAELDNSNRTPSHVNDLETSGNCVDQISCALADGNVSQMMDREGNAIAQLNSRDESVSHLHLPIEESVRSEELPTAGTCSFNKVNVAEMKKQEIVVMSSTPVEGLCDVKSIFPVHINHKDSERNSADGTLGLMDVSAVTRSSMSLEVSHSSEYGHAYDHTEVDFKCSSNCNYDSDDVYHNDAVVEKVSSLQADSDSQYEDGEFREPVLHGWEGNEDDEREAEHVDYGSDNLDYDPFEPSAEYAVVDSVEGNKEIPHEVGFSCPERSSMKNDLDSEHQPALIGSVEMHVSPIESCEGRTMEVMTSVSSDELLRKDCKEKVEMNVKVDSGEKIVGGKVLVHEELASRESYHSMALRSKSTGWDQLPDASRRCRDNLRDFKDTGTANGCFVHQLDSSYAEETSRKVIRSTSSRELPSCIEGPKCSNTSYRKDKECVDGSRSSNVAGVNPRIKREDGMGKPTLGRKSPASTHRRGRVDHWLDSSGGHWGQNHHHSPNHLGPDDPGLKNAFIAAAAKLESNGYTVSLDGTIVGVGDRSHRRPANASLKSECCSQIQRRSPNDRDGLRFVMPLGRGRGRGRGRGHLRELSPGKSITGGRGRSRRYGPRVCGSDQRDRHGGPLHNDDTNSSLPMQHSLGRRQRSISPISRRALHYSRSFSRSPSRLRCHSPQRWTSSRGRSTSQFRGSDLQRRLSKSPSKQAKIMRLGSPNRRLAFPEHMGVSRIHDSSPHISRWIRRGHAPDDHREDDYKQSSVPERSARGEDFTRTYKFDMESPGRMKLHDRFRPMHSGRVLEFVEGARGRCGSGLNDDARQKHGERYGSFPSVRHYDDGSSGKHFRYNEDDFWANQPHTKVVSESRQRGNPRGYGRGFESRLGGASNRDGQR